MTHYTLQSKLGVRMPTPINEPNVSTRLRQMAEAKLETGTTRTTGHWSMGVDALRLLHRLSSNPDEAEDALKLLHELQVHQVELDLQVEEIAVNERALVEDLRHYQTVFDCAPHAYFVVDLEGAVLQGNLAAAELFGVGQEDLEGRRIDTFVNPQNRPLLLDLLQRVAESGARDSCVAETGWDAEGSRHLQLVASTPPGREHILLLCCDYGHVE